MVNPDNRTYYHFTGPQRLDKAMHSLEGLLRGIAADRSANDREIELLRAWLDEHREFSRRHPFNEVIPRLDAALAGGTFDPEVVADVLWLCGRMRTENGYFNAVTCDMQRLQGIIGGVSSDGAVTMEELDAVSNWMQEHERLRTCWPYDEIESLLTAVRADRFIDPKEHHLLVRFFAEFTRVGDHRMLNLPLNEATVPITGMCAVCPDIEIVSRAFCFTGSSEKATRKQLAEIVEQHGGQFTDRLRQGVDYLVIGADGNPCWAYACYGRKVEQAIEYRKKGSRMLLVHEYDFWDAVEDAGR